MVIYKNTYCFRDPIFGVTTGFTVVSVSFEEGLACYKGGVIPSTNAVWPRTKFRIPLGLLAILSYIAIYSIYQLVG